MGSGKNYYYLPTILKGLQKKERGDILTPKKEGSLSDKTPVVSKHWDLINFKEVQNFNGLKEKDIVFVDDWSHVIPSIKYPLEHRNLVLCLQDVSQADELGIDVKEFTIIKSKLPEPNKTYLFGLIKVNNEKKLIDTIETMF